MTEQRTYIVIFGATGNLSREKLMPALYQLDAANRLSQETIILAVGRKSYNLDQWVAEVRGMLTVKARQGLNETVFTKFQNKLDYFKGDLDDPEMYPRLKAQLTSETNGSPKIVFYMAIYPDQYGQVVEKLSQVGLLQETAESSWRRVVIEKPFGRDLNTALELQQKLTQHLKETQTYRIDHYLGKSTVQNVLVFRFANLMLEPLWNRNYIDHVQITHGETIGVSTRGDFYDKAGAMRDMIQSHLLQLLTLVAMEPPVSMEAEALRAEKIKVLKSIRPLPIEAVPTHAVRAQYTAGIVHGQQVKGYLQEDKVPTNSTTETYAAMKLFIDNWRWAGVPFYLRTGKRLFGNQSMVAICLKQPPQQFFQASQLQRLSPNWILLGIQPNDSLRVEVTVKIPGLEMHTQPISLNASLPRDHGTANDAYEELLLDVIEGDHSLFLHHEEVEYAWKVIDPIIKAWANDKTIAPYLAGTWGPEESRRLFDRDGRCWRHSLDPEKEC